jgi:hypothetical protein
VKEQQGVKVGDFVKHKEAPELIFQVVQVLQSAEEGRPGMLNCVQVHDIHSYLENDVVKYELKRKDERRIMENRCP